MTPVRLRPDLRLPWQALAGFGALLYVLESALRGWDFRPTLMDGLIFGTLFVILALRPLLSRVLEDKEDEAP